MLDMQVTTEELTARLLSLENRVEEMRDSLRCAHSQNFAEQAHEREDDEVFERLEADAIVEISAIKAALSRIETGRYGACSGCGEEIEEKRLKILPFTSCCINCAE